MGKLIEMIGKRCGRLIVVSRVANSKDGKPKYFCQCDCGTKTIVCGKLLRAGKTKSCGCYRYERLKEAITKHGFCHTKTYNTWASMIDRCTNKKCGNYRWYGGRGIVVCDRWVDFKNFLEDMGQKPKYKSIDRINVNGNYEPSNCRWATPIEQANNRRGNVVLTFNGTTQSLCDWARQLNIPRTTLFMRYYKGQTAEQILTVPKHEVAKVMFRGKLMTYPQIADAAGVPYVTLRWRARKGLPLPV